MSRKPGKAQRTIRAKRGTPSKPARNRRLSALSKDTEAARLARELAEAREQQSATSEVLRVISSSPGGLEAVFQVILENAVRLCEASFGMLFRFEEGAWRAVAMLGVPPKFADFWRRGPLQVGPRTGLGRIAATRQTVHFTDVTSEPAEPVFLAAIKLGGFRTAVGVPILNDKHLIGAIFIYCQELRPFSDKQIALVSNFASQAVIAIENARLLNELRESLQQQTATANVLEVISRSAFDLQPVLDTVVESSVRLCEADKAFFYRYDGEFLRVTAALNASQDLLEFLRRNPIRPEWRHSVTARAALERRTFQTPDMQADPELTYGSRDVDPVRTVLGVPVLKGEDLLGVILIYRLEVKPFTDHQIALIETFADQAAIAIENVRLFEAEQASKRELQDSLQQQTATADVLSVISSSPGDLVPVFQAMLSNAVRICGGKFGDLYLREADGFRMAASHNAPPAYVAARTRESVLRPPSDAPLGRLAATKQLVQIADIKTIPSYIEGHPFVRAAVDLAGYRTVLVVPMLKDDQLIGAIGITRKEIQPFTEKQIALVQNFAKQAVIAIENTRLLNELRESLQQQTATAEVLKVISRSTFDLHNVLNTLAEAVAELCDAYDVVILLRDGDSLVVRAHYGPIPLDFSKFPVTRTWTAGRAVVDRKPVYVHDLLAAGDEFPDGHAISVRLGQRTILSVPLLREDEAVGCITIRRAEVRPFTQRQIELATIFADQAVIAIENTRLFEEVQARNRDLTALGEVGRAVSSTLDLKIILKTIVERAVELSGTDGGSIFYYREEIDTFELGETTGLDAEVVTRFSKLDISATGTGLSEAIIKRQPLNVADLTRRMSNPLRDAALEAGLFAALIVPLLGGEGPLGALVLQRRTPGEFPATVVSLMQNFADQSVIALENARLFEEIAQKSRELEIASQHKSQFVANMSHELRTPLAAMLGYAELMQEGIYEPLGEKSLAALTRIRSNGKHLLGLINTVLDIAKIESGQFTLNMAEYSIETVVETVRAATESLAQNKKLALTTAITKPLPIGTGDEQRLTQVLLNLVGNAIKFTDTGEVRVTAEAIDGHFAISVVDTGPGIPEQERTRIFEQFHQVDDSNTKAKGGTGLGLAIAKQIVEMHGGRIWVDSTVGKGSSFQMELPVRAEKMIA
jgi:GAF domain-containing protein